MLKGAESLAIIRINATQKKSVQNQTQLSRTTPKPSVSRVLNTNFLRYPLGPSKSLSANVTTINANLNYRNRPVKGVIWNQ